MKNIFKFLLFTFTILFMSHNSYADIPLDIKKIISHGKLIIAVNSNEYSPFFYLNENKELEGYDIHLAEDIAKNLGVTVEFNRSASNFNDVIKLVEDEKADIAISAISATLSRGLRVRFSDPYLTLKQCIILNRLLEVKIKNNIKLNDKLLKIAILKNSSYEEYVNHNMTIINENFKDFTLVKYESLDRAFQDVLHGKILGLYVDELYADKAIKNEKLANIYLRKHIIQDAYDPISIAINWKNNNLANWINFYIQRMKSNGKERSLSLKYLRETYE
jgi:polar amino acid transport system substrate-binding protein